MLRAYIEPIETFLESDGPVQDILNKVNGISTSGDSRSISPLVNTYGRIRGYTCPPITVMLVAEFLVLTLSMLPN